MCESCILDIPGPIAYYVRSTKYFIPCEVIPSYNYNVLISEALQKLVIVVLVFVCLFVCLFVYFVVCLLVSWLV